MQFRGSRRLCACRYIVELYEVIDWNGKKTTEWKLADETWECNAERIYFYDCAEAPQTLLDLMTTREKKTDAGGHGWAWQA